MKREVRRPPRVSFCRRCVGTGVWRHLMDDGTPLTGPCPQCEGSGWVTVSSVTEYDIRPYRRAIHNS
nr:MAG TPA: antitermination protein [Caudoviricetes sp.]